MIGAHECEPLTEFCEARLDAAAWNHAERPRRRFETAQEGAEDPIEAIEDWTAEQIREARDLGRVSNVPPRLVRANHAMQAWCEDRRARRELPIDVAVMGLPDDSAEALESIAGVISSRYPGHPVTVEVA